MKKELLVFAFVLFGISLISGLSSSDYQTFCNMDLSEQMGKVEVPSYVPYQNEVFNISIIEENLKGKLTIEEGKISSFSCDEVENPTYNIYIKDLSVVEEIGSSENFLETYNGKIASGDIEIKGVGFGKKIKLTFTKILLKIVSWFS